MKNLKLKLIGIITFILAAGIFYYVTLPAINIHSKDFWVFLIILVVVIAILFARKKGIRTKAEVKASVGMKLLLTLVAAVAIVFVVGTVLSSPIVNAKKYQGLMKVEESEFTADVEELSYDQIPLLDKESAALLGNRKMGSMVDMVSQFEVDEIYTQSNYKDKPVRVSPLRYASLIKWLTNRSEGIPAYIRIDMATQTTELVKLDEGMKYTTSEHFNRNIYRHLRFKYPTYIFNDFGFETDDEGVPYWVCPVKKFNIGLFGG